MRSVFNFLIFTGAIIGVLFLALNRNGSPVGSCGAQRIATVPSPDGEWQGIHDFYSCDRDHRVETLVYLAPAKGRPPANGEFPVLRAKDKSTAVGLTWIGDRELRVTYPASSHAEQLFATGRPGMDERMRVEYRAVTPGQPKDDGS